jgi:hypothetical protein
MRDMAFRVTCFASVHLDTSPRGITDLGVQAIGKPVVVDFISSKSKLAVP